MLLNTTTPPIIKEEFLKNFGTNLKRIRVEKGISQKELVDRIKTSQSYLAKIELGQLNPSIAQVASIATALSIPVRLLFQFAPSQN